MKTFIVSCIALLLSASALAQQGICGKVIWTSGNQMPGPDRKPEAASKGIEREVYIYEATTTNQAKQTNGFYTSVETKLVKKIKTKKDGTFSVKLAEGTYTVFVKEQDGLWANMFDGEGRINPVVVTSKQFTTLTLNVNYTAAY